MKTKKLDLKWLRNKELGGHGMGSAYCLAMGSGGFGDQGYCPMLDSYVQSPACIEGGSQGWGEASPHCTLDYFNTMLLVVNGLG